MRFKEMISLCIYFLQCYMKILAVKFLPVDSECMIRACAQLTCGGCCHTSAAWLTAVAQRCCISMFRADLPVCEMPPLPPDVTLLVPADLKFSWARVSTLHEAWWRFTLQGTTVSQSRSGEQHCSSIFSSQTTPWTSKLNSFAVDIEYKVS